MGCHCVDLCWGRPSTPCEFGQQLVWARVVHGQKLIDRYLHHTERITWRHRKLNRLLVDCRLGNQIGESE